MTASPPLYQILDDLGKTVDIHRQSTPHDELVERLQQYDGQRTAVILDEVESPTLKKSCSAVSMSGW
jgi:NADPH:quinone reductase-like Zn-dependent oxidoreductase